MAVEVNEHLPYHWRERLCQLLLIPLRPETLRLLTAWARAEGGTAKNNPLNTTYPMPWSTAYNSIGVRNYDTPVEGVAATASTFARDRRYRQLWADMQATRYTAEQLVDRNETAIKTWGTDTDLLRRVLAEMK